MSSKSGSVWIGNWKKRITEILKKEFLKTDLPDKLVKIDTGTVIRLALEFVFEKHKTEFFEYLREKLKEGD